MKVLVTGGLGFIGAHLTRELDAAGHNVATVDKRAGATYVHDLLHTPAAAILDDHRPDAVVHLAAQVGRLFGEDDPRDAVRSNAEMTTMLAHDCGDRNIRLAFASTSEVYGDQGDLTLHEDDPLELPHNIYGLSKRWAEEAVSLYTPRNLIFRMFMPYGPGAPPGRGRRALDTFLWQAHHRQPMQVHAGAERSWCWVGDTVHAIRMLLEQHRKGVWNIGRSDRPVAMIDLAKQCCRLAGAPQSLIRIVEPPPRQTVVKRVDTSKLHAIGWQPQTDLEDGLALVYDWVRNFDKEGQWLNGNATKSQRQAQ